MLFSIGTVLALLGWLWYSQTEYSKDWRDAVQFVMMLVGSGLVTLSLLILAWQYLP
jgi:hypothetical protein